MESRALLVGQGEKRPADLLQVNAALLFGGETRLVEPGHLSLPPQLAFVFEVLIALVLIALNGLFALSELAVVSSRKARLKTMADQRRPGAHAALALAEEPGRFLSTVQIGITLVSILAGAFSGAALSERFDTILESWGISTRLAEPLAYVLVLGGITYLSVIIGELVPKNLALKNPEGIACAVAPLMRLISRAAAPVVWLLDASTKLIFRLLGVRPRARARSRMRKSGPSWRRLRQPG